MDVFAISGAASLAYDVVATSGEGPGVLLFHAGVADRRSWLHLTDALGAVGTVVAYDARGFGTTTYSPEPHSAVDDALAVMAAAGLDAPVVVGASMGGGVAVDLARARPENVSALVLIAPAVSGVPELETDQPAVQQIAGRIAAAERDHDLDEVNRGEAHLWLDGPDAPEGRVTGEARQLFLDMNLRALKAADPGEEAPRDAWQHLEEIDVPALVLVGDQDVQEFQDHAQEVSKRLPAGRLVRLEGVAHLPHLEGHRPCLEAVASFVRDQRGV